MMKSRPWFTGYLIFANTVVFGVILFGVANAVALWNLKLKSIKWRNLSSYRLRMTDPHQSLSTWTEPDGTVRNVIIKNDEQGLRKPTWQTSTTPTAQDREKLQVFLYGGSTTYGFGVDDDHTMPALVEKKLGRSGVRVFNFGQNGYAIKQEANFLVDHLMQGYRPDLVIFYDGINEEAHVKRALSLNLPYVYRETDYGYEWLQNILNQKVNQTRILHPDLLPVLKWYLSSREHPTSSDSALYPPLWDGEKGPGGEPTVSPVYMNYYGKAHAQTYLSKVSFLQRLAQSYQFRVVHILQPFNLFLLPDQGCIIELPDQIDAHSLLNNYFKTLYDQIGQGFVKAAAGGPSELVDLRFLFRDHSCDKGKAFREGQHLNELGNDVLAERIAREIKKVIAARSLRPKTRETPL